MASELTFDIERQNFYSTVFVQNHIFRFPDGGCLFHVEFYYGAVLLVSCSAEGRVWLFDHEISVGKGSKLCLRLVASNLDFYLFFVEVESPRGMVDKGTLRVGLDGMVFFNDNVIETAKSRSKYAKALMLCG